MMINPNLFFFKTKTKNPENLTQRSNWSASDACLPLCCLTPCNKHYTFLHHNSMLVDWLCCELGGSSFSKIYPCMLCWLMPQGFALLRVSSGCCTFCGPLFCCFHMLSSLSLDNFVFYYGFYLPSSQTALRTISLALFILI